MWFVLSLLGQHIFQVLQTGMLLCRNKQEFPLHTRTSDSFPQEKNENKWIPKRIFFLLYKSSTHLINGLQTSYYRQVTMHVQYMLRNYSFVPSFYLRSLIEIVVYLLIAAYKQKIPKSRQEAEPFLWTRRQIVFSSF